MEGEQEEREKTEHGSLFVIFKNYAIVHCTSSLQMLYKKLKVIRKYFLSWFCIYNKKYFAHYMWNYNALLADVMLFQMKCVLLLTSDWFILVIQRCMVPCIMVPLVY